MYAEQFARRHAVLALRPRRRVQPAAAERTPPPDAKRVDASKAGTSCRARRPRRARSREPADQDRQRSLLRARAPGRRASETFVVEPEPSTRLGSSTRLGTGPRERLRLREGRPRQLLSSRRRPSRREAGSEGVPLRAARHRRAQTGQPLEISNSDETLHNVHAHAEGEPRVQLRQAMQGIKNTTTFTAPEVMVPLQVRRAQLDERLRRRARITRTSR